jgi:DNA-binding MarR family transcriptional regulator
MSRAVSTPARADLTRRLTEAVRRQVAWTVLHNQAIAERLGMSATDLHATNLLDIEGPITAGRLAELMGLTTGAVTGVLDRLERAGLVRREADPADRRRVVARLVPEGMERVRAAFVAVGTGVQDLYAGYDDSQLSLLAEYAERNAEITRRITAQMRAGAPVSDEAGDGEMSAPLGSATAGRLEISGNAANLRIRSDPGRGLLYTATFERRAPRIRARGGTVTVAYPGIFALGAGRGVIGLNAGIPWTVELRGGASNVDADLTGVPLTGFSLTGGSSRVECRLPQPIGTMALRVRGGASRIAFRRPAGVPVRVRVEGGLSKLRVDARQYRAMGGPAVLDSPGYEDATDRYELTVDGGASHITVDGL